MKINSVVPAGDGDAKKVYFGSSTACVVVRDGAIVNSPKEIVTEADYKRLVEAAMNYECRIKAEAIPVLRTIHGKVMGKGEFPVFVTNDNTTRSDLFLFETDEARQEWIEQTIKSSLRPMTRISNDTLHQGRKPVERAVMPTAHIETR